MLLWTKILQTNAIKGLPNLTQVLFLGLWFHSLAFSSGNRFTPKSLKRRFKRHSCEVTKGAQPIFSEEKKSCGKNGGLSCFKFKQHPLPHTQRHMCIYLIACPHKLMRVHIHTNQTNRHTWAGAYKCVHTHANTHVFSHIPSLDRPDGWAVSLSQRTDCCFVQSRVSHHSLTFACTHRHIHTHWLRVYNATTAA